MPENESPETNSQAARLSDNDIFTKIWASPRQVFKFLDEWKYDKYLMYLLFLAGIYSGVYQSTKDNAGQNMPLLLILAICIFGGGLLGWISYYIYAALTSWTGKWLKGHANTDSILRILAHAMIPAIVSLLAFIPQIIIFGKWAFQKNIDMGGMGIVPIFVHYLCSFISIVLGIWSLVLVIIGISEVQGFSVGKSILNLILPVFIIFVPVAIIAFILGGILR
jgi:hypothetical protein